MLSEIMVRHERKMSISWRKHFNVDVALNMSNVAVLECVIF
jgi:hypothetical protein